jgi:hypothetical protein
MHINVSQTSQVEAKKVYSLTQEYDFDGKSREATEG